MDVEKLVEKYESLVNGSGGRKVVVRTGGRSEQIRQVVRALLEKKKEGVLLGAVVQLLREEMFKGEEYRKVRMWVENAVSIKSSGMRLEKRDGRVWIVRA